MIQMKYYLPKITFLCVCFAVLIAASAVKAQAIYPAEESETITATSPNGNQTVTVILPRRAIQPAEVAIIVNRQDPQSVDVAAYYQLVRNIPAANVIEVSFPAALTSITQKDFEIIKAQVDAAVSALPDIQALVITWTEPWKVKRTIAVKACPLPVPLPSGSTLIITTTHPWCAKRRGKHPTTIRIPCVPTVTLVCGRR